MIVALFDLDGTLYTGHIGRGILQHHRLHRTNRFYLYAFLAALTPIWMIGRLVSIPEASLRNIWVRNMSWVVRGWTPQEGAKAFSWIAKEYVAPLVRANIIERVRHHQASGHRAILVSGTFAPLLAAIGRELGIKDTVGTALRLRKGRYVGSCEGTICQGPGKWLMVEAYLRGDSVAWDQSYAYADSYADLSLLEKVGHPVAVCPDRQLAAHAQGRGWEVIEDG